VKHNLGDKQVEYDVVPNARDVHWDEDNCVLHIAHCTLYDIVYIYICILYIALYGVLYSLFCIVYCVVLCCIRY
jgi:hypothetical protein